MSKPLISIITATYNDKLQLLKTSESIKESTYRNIEWVVIDGLSTDGTFEWLKSNTDVVRKWVSEPDCGIYDAWNKGLAKAEGEWDTLVLMEIVAKLKLKGVAVFCGFEFVRE